MDRFLPDVYEKTAVEGRYTYKLGSVAGGLVCYSSLRRYWRRYHGEESFSDYRNSCFLRKSCRLLVETNLRVKEIALELEFSDPFYFSRKFRHLTGLSPLEYRKRNRMFP